MRVGRRLFVKEDLTGTRTVGKGERGGCGKASHTSALQEKAGAHPPPTEHQLHQGRILNGDNHQTRA